jgi:hypothetical protein
LKAAVKYSPDLVKTERGFSTQKILATELDLIQTVNAGCDAVAPLHPGYGLRTGWAKINSGRFTMSCAPVTASPACAVWLAAAKPRRCASWSPPARRQRLNRCSARRRRRRRKFCAKKGFEAKTLQSLC